MGNRLDRSTKIQLWVIFGLFVGLIIGMIGYEINKVYQAKQQRENFEKIRKFETRRLHKEAKKAKEEAKQDTLSEDLRPE